MVDGTLPNLLIAGVPRAGTTSLFAYLTQHPDIAGSVMKEPRYFSPLAREDGKLAPLSAYTKTIINRCAEPYALEATPTYCYGGERMRRAIAEVLPGVRVLIILRDPVDRLVSAYRFERHHNHLGSVRSFDEYVEEIEGAPPWTGPIEHRHRTPRQAFTIGCYDTYLPAWLEEFGDRVRVLFFEDLIRDPAAEVADICRWLQLDPEPAASFNYTARNRAMAARSRMLARLAHIMRRYLKGLLPRGSELRRRVRRLYRRLNSRPPTERINPEIRARLGDLYRPSTRAVAVLLRDRGYALPMWVSLGLGAWPVDQYP